MRDALHSMTVRRCISPDEGAGDNTAKVGQIIDHQGYESVTYVIATGTIVDADATFTVLLEEGNNSDLSDAVAVADGDMISQGSGAPETDAAFQFNDDDEVRTLGYRGTKRYSRLTITPANNTGAWDISAVCILSDRRTKPFTQPAS